MKKKEERKMEMRRLKYPWVIVFVAALTLIFGAGIAAAIPTASTTCTLVDSAGTGNYGTVTANSPQGFGENTIWSYNIIGLSTKGTQAAALVPACDPISSIDYFGNKYFIPSTESGDVYLAPASSISTNWNGFGVWDEYNDLVTVTSLGPSTFAFGTDNAVPIPTDYGIPIQFKYGNKYLYCRNIKGPGCAEAPPPRAQGVVSLATRYEGIDPYTQQRYEYCATTDPATQCQQVVDCDTMEPKSTIPMTSLNFGSTDGSKLADISVPGVACPGIVLSDNAENSTYYCNPRTGYCVKLN